jgi:hypothetical protein
MKLTYRTGAILALFTVVAILSAGCSDSEEKAHHADCKDLTFLEDAHEAVVSAYGDFYIPSVSIETSELETVYDIIAERPMMSTVVDTFIGIRAKEGCAQEIAGALNAYRDKLMEDESIDPINRAKVEASTVCTVEDHVFFLMLGAPNERVDISDEEALDFASHETEKGVTAIEELLN